MERSWASFLESESNVFSASLTALRSRFPRNNFFFRKNNPKKNLLTSSVESKLKALPRKKSAENWAGATRSFGRAGGHSRLCCFFVQFVLRLARWSLRRRRLGGTGESERTLGRFAFVARSARFSFSNFLPTKTVRVLACYQHFAPQQPDGLWSEIDNILGIISTDAARLFFPIFNCGRKSFEFPFCRAIC